MSETEGKFRIPFCCAECNEKPAVLFVFGKPLCSDCMALSISTRDLDPEISKVVNDHFWDLI